MLGNTVPLLSEYERQHATCNFVRWLQKRKTTGQETIRGLQSFKRFFSWWVEPAQAKRTVLKLNDELAGFVMLYGYAV